MGVLIAEIGNSQQQALPSTDLFRGLNIISPSELNSTPQINQWMRVLIAEIGNSQQQALPSTDLFGGLNLIS